MRAAVVALGLAGAGLIAGPFAAGQEKAPPPPEIPVRYGLPFNPKAYPQGTAKDALVSVIAAADQGDFAYLAAHLLDPAFVDARVDAMTAGPNNPYRKAVEAELARILTLQRQNPDAVPPAKRVPDDARLVEDRATAEAKVMAFGQLTRLIREKIADDPQTLKDLRRFVRAGAFPDPGAPGDAAKVELPDVKDRAVFLRRVNGRWYVENRQAEEKAAPAKEPEPKKEPEKKD